MFPCDATDRRIAYDVLRVVNPEKAQVKVARVKSGSGQDAEANNPNIQLPWARQNGGVGREVGYCSARFIALFLAS